MRLRTVCGGHRKNKGAYLSTEHSCKPASEALLRDVRQEFKRFGSLQHADTVETATGWLKTVQK